MTFASVALTRSIATNILLNLGYVVDEAKELLEVGFEYVTDMDGLKLFRRRK